MKQEFLDGLKEWFSAYVRPFRDLPEGPQAIELKEAHTANVCRNIAMIAGAEGLKTGDIVLAEAIGLLHDVGRFPQYARYGTFKDSQSENHGELGVRVIAESHILEGLPEDERAIVISSVKFHNAFSMPLLESRPALFLKLIRDADKLDIWRVFIDYFARPRKFASPREQAAYNQSLGFPGGQGISGKVLESLKAGEKIPLSEAVTDHDVRILQLSWIYGLNFQMSFRTALERGIVDKIFAQLPDFEDKDSLRSKLNKFLREKSAGNSQLNTS